MGCGGGGIAVDEWMRASNFSDAPYPCKGPNCFLFAAFGVMWLRYAAVSVSCFRCRFCRGGIAFDEWMRASNVSDAPYPCTGLSCFLFAAVGPLLLRPVAVMSAVSVIVSAVVLFLNDRLSTSWSLLFWFSVCRRRCAVAALRRCFRWLAASLFLLQCCF